MKTTSDNDLIMRGDVLNAFCNHSEVVIHNGKPSFVVNYPNVIRSIPAVPQEMSAVELYSAYLRICKEYSGKGKPIRCYECPLYVNCPRIIDALRIVVMCSPNIEKWAQEHPERSEDDGEDAK